MPLIKKKISEFPLADSLKGLYTIGYKIIDGIKTSVKVSLEDIQTAYQDVVNAIKKSEEATSNANNAAVTAEEKATAANVAAQEAEKIANNPTYIGKDHYVYVYNKDTGSFDRTDIYCKGEPGSSFRVAGEYATLEALKSAVPDGSAVDGFMAVGTEAPYEYYAWVNGEWVSQGNIGGIDEAPTDGKAYGRKNGDWAEVSDKKYVDDSISSARSVGYMMQLTEIDATGLDENTWYPVTIAAGGRMNIRVEVLVSLDSGTKPSWSQHERGFSTRKIWEFVPNVWGVNRDSNITIYLSDFVHADIDPVRGLGNLSHFDTCYVFVRGGGKYHFYASHEAKVILHTDTYAPGDQSVSPTTETPAGIVANIATKEHVDDKHILLTITNEAHQQLISNQEVKAGEAESKINLVFGSIDNFKNIIQRLLSDNILFLKITEKEFFKVSTSHTYCNPDNGAYELSFIFTYTSIADANNISLVTKRIFIALNSIATNFFVVKDILVSDNLTTLTKKTAAEYEAIGSKDDNTAYCVTD